MEKETWTQVDRYMNDKLLGSDPVLEAALKDSDTAGLPSIHVSPSQGKFLQLLAQGMNARRILEIGTLAGHSTICLARALPPDGHLISLEYEEKHARGGPVEHRQGRLGRHRGSHSRPGSEQLPKLKAGKAASFDLIFIDADKQGYPDYFPWALRLAHRGTLIVADNVVRNGEVINAKSSNAGVPGVRRFIELVASEPRVSATVVQTVGSKGYDGFLIARVNADL